MAVPITSNAAVSDVTTAGTLLWGFDGTDIGTDGGGVTSLNNQAATAAGDALRTNLGTSGGGQAQVISANTGAGLHNVIQFDGADDTYLSDFTSATSGAQQIFIVARFDENSGEGFNNYIIDGENNSGRRATGVRGTTSHYFTSDGGDIITTIPLSLNEWQVITLTLGGASDTFAITDGTLAGTYSETQNNANTHAMTGLTVGGRTETPSATTRFNGQIAEILVYNSNLSSGDITAVQTYLLDKYIVAVPEPSSLALVGLGSLLWIRRRNA